MLLGSVSGAAQGWNLPPAARRPSSQCTWEATTVTVTTMGSSQNRGDSLLAHRELLWADTTISPS